ncbi:Stromal cell-derived factor 2-like protein 1 [Eufriesea mexicana]|uniref:stromal cell-derived factor 2-like protein 1 n=1 Tax=Eufriesea mexicana TaxID=516756 RepID=UPI00083C1BCC|nr:PREDICTED: stromal cell-derived factor 2-like protein 1 [Eufriesea mexicana]OAD60620.1 Stromal cell-derived factor 2-like protein 1 [Eufriesea mexicana]
MKENFVYFTFMISFVIFVFWTNSVKAKGTQHVTCGSVLKLMNVNYKVRLHSHDIKYGSGSGQQSVTGTTAKEDGNSYWLVKAGTKNQCTRGAPIECGNIIRLEHIATKKNLHSHRVVSILSGKQEISAYGNHKGEGDDGDNWLLKCDSDFWRRNETIMLKHVDTDTYLAVSGITYNNPISGQIEVVGDYYSNSPHVQWITTEGIFIHPNDFEAQHHAHTEL